MQSCAAACLSLCRSGHIEAVKKWWFETPVNTLGGVFTCSLSVISCRYGSVTPMGPRLRGYGFLPAR